VEDNYLDYTERLADVLALAYRAYMLSDNSQNIKFNEWLRLQGAELARHPESKRFTLYFDDCKIKTLFILKWVK